MIEVSTRIFHLVKQETYISSSTPPSSLLTTSYLSHAGPISISSLAFLIANQKGRLLLLDIVVTVVYLLFVHTHKHAHIQSDRITEIQI